MGFLNKIKTGAKKAVKDYRDYQAKAPEREKARIQRLKAETKRINSEYNLVRARGRLNKARSQTSSSLLPFEPLSSSFGMQQPIKKGSKQKPKKKSKARNIIIQL